MSLVMALEDIKPELVNKPGKFKDGHPGSMGTAFFRKNKDRPRDPHASLVRYPPGEQRTSSAHYHQVDQFQVIMEGKGTFGRHEVTPYSIHFTRAFTRYGPLKSDGWAFMVLRTRYDSGSQRDFEKLKQVPNRRPFQVTTQVDFPAAGSGASMQDIAQIRDDQGLFVSTLTMAAHATMTAPDASGGDGQHLLVVKGSILHDNREKQAPVVIFTRPDDPAFEIRAGAQGLQAIIMNFPKVGQAATAALRQPSGTEGLKTWQCLLCAFAYDEARGMPEEGIAPGTRWADVPDTWSCPDCGAAKNDFEMIEL